MTTFQVTIEVGDPQGQRLEEGEVTVGIRTVFTALPGETLQRLCIPVKESVPARTPEGDRVLVDASAEKMLLLREWGKTRH